MHLMTQADSPVSVLQKKKSTLIARFLEGDEPAFQARHAEILDDYFRDTFAGSSVGPGMGFDKNPHAIIALGGYGRQEQCVHSDVDVLLLFKKKVPDQAKGLVQEIFYPLWDMGLEVGHATRSLKECISLASKDFEVLTSLIDARFVCGISSLYSLLMVQLQEKVLRRRGAVYLNWLAERNRARHARFGDATYLLEPNIKEGLGGLRDYHAMLWVARAAFNAVEPRDLEFLGYLSHDEFQSLEDGLSFIGGVRNWLHHLTGRKCDQLYFEYQIKLAEALGFEEINGQTGVERFLGALHGKMEFLKRQHLIFLGRAMAPKGKFRKRKSSRRVITPGIVLMDETLHFESPEVILEKPNLLIKIFEHSAVLGFPLSIDATRLVREFLYLVDEKFQTSRKVIKSFRRILAAPLKTLNVLNDMLTTGILVALIPELKGIVNLIQYDEYHVHPVDKHSLRTVQTLKGFRNGGPETQDAFYGALLSEIDRPDLLLWAALLHDAGKAIDVQNHSSRGAEIVRQVFERMGFPEQDIERVSFLVHEHLSLIHMATRRDINDERVVIECARGFPDVDLLKMLYLLTVADSKATGPKAWGEWTDTLLRELFVKILRILEKGELATQASAELVEAKKADVLEHAVALPREQLEALFDQMSPRYLFYTKAKDIIRHIELYERLGEESFHLETQAKSRSKYRTVTVCAKDFPGLFSKIAGVLTLNNLDILSAQIYTWRNHIALDIFRVKAPPDRLHEDEVWARVSGDLRSALAGTLALESALSKKVQAYRSLKKKIAIQPDRVVVNNEASDFFTVVEVYTHDFPGLLYRVTDALFRCKLDIWVAKIGTKADQVVDVFYVRDFDGQKVVDPKEMEAIKETITDVLSADPLALLAP
jgi:[protein-PII] uridylyltransferase